MVFTKTNAKKMGRPSKSMQKRLRQEFESVIRTGGRVKKAKKVFDPSENNPPRKRGRMQSTIDTERPKSDYCQENSNGSLQSKTDKKKKGTTLSYYKKRKLAETQKAMEKAQDEFCSICSKKSENLIHCQDCNIKVHKICMITNFQNVKLLEAKWRCDTCKNCAICYENAESEPLITCSVCVDSYHYKCHIPNMACNDDNSNINWVCTKCLPKPQFKPAILKSRRITLSKELSIQNEQNNIKLNTEPIVKLIDLNNEMNSVYDIEDDDEEDIEFDENNTSNFDNDKINQKLKIRLLTQIPDVSKWSCDQLSNFITEYFPSESKVLREQEIDGASLLLLTRTDVINGLKLKLGAAIRLYNFITLLQTKKNDITANWLY